MSYDEKKTLKLDDYEFKLLRDFIAEHFGIFYEDDQKWLMESKLGRLLLNKKINSFFEYYQYLMNKFFMSQSYDDVEFVDLINSIANNETYFNREPAAFKTMTDCVLPELLNSGKKEIRILSAACSSGEEPYSIAIHFLESKNNGPLTLEVVAVDIDLHSLIKGRNGIYKFNAFRGMDDEHIKSRFLSHFILQKDDTGHPASYSVTDVLREMVSFYQCNLLDMKALQAAGTFDMIFCRNMLIYAHLQAKERIIRNFESILRPGGHLFLGHSETLFDINCDLQLKEKMNYLLYQKSAF